MRRQGQGLGQGYNNSGVAEDDDWFPWGRGCVMWPQSRDHNKPGVADHDDWLPGGGGVSGDRDHVLGEEVNRKIK